MRTSGGKTKQRTLLVGRDAFFVLDLLLDRFNCVAGINIQCDSLARKGLHKDLHARHDYIRVSGLIAWEVDMRCVVHNRRLWGVMVNNVHSLCFVGSTADIVR